MNGFIWIVLGYQSRQEVFGSVLIVLMQRELKDTKLSELLRAGK